MATIDKVKIGATTYTITPSISQSNQTSVSSVVSAIGISSNDGMVVYSTSNTLTLSSINATYITATSDVRLKENITNVNSSELCDSFDNIQLHYYNFKDDKNKQTNIGVLAQELQEALPKNIVDSIVIKGDNGYYSVAENKLIYLCITKIKELEQEIIKLKNK